MAMAERLPVNSFYLANPHQLNEEELVRKALQAMQELHKACDYVKVEDSPTEENCKVLMFCNVKNLEAVQLWIIKEGLRVTDNVNRGQH